MMCKIIKSPRMAFSIIALISFSSLAFAFIAEGMFNLEPCKLCIYQRYPFAIGLFISLIGLAIGKKQKASGLLLFICGLSFAVNSGIAVFHTGVEQHWWQSVEGCVITFSDENDSTKSVLENIMSAPMGSCDEIPWQDPVLGLSMANHNIWLSFVLFLFCIISGFMTFRNVSRETKSEQT